MFHFQYSFRVYCSSVIFIVKWNCLVLGYCYKCYALFISTTFFQWLKSQIILVIKVLFYPKFQLLWDSILITVCSLAEADSDNYIAYYRRATVYLAMGKSKAAICDLSKAVELRQDFTSVSITAIESVQAQTPPASNLFFQVLLNRNIVLLIRLLTG